MAAVVIAAVKHANEVKEKARKRRESQLFLDKRIDEVLGKHQGDDEEDEEEQVVAPKPQRSEAELASLRYDRMMKGQPTPSCCGWEAPMKFKKEVYIFYNGNVIQMLVAALIMINFIVNAAEAQVPELELKPGQETPDKEGQAIFDAFELFFTVVFTIELAVNMYAHWWKDFWFSGWNLFDFFVVMISLLTLLFEGLPGISTLRLMRAFRVFRLFKRLASLRKILKALENAVPGCSNAFSIVVLVNAIYSILGVEFFRNHVESGSYFKNFSVAMFSLFQIMTGDSWASVIARPIIDDWPHAAIYFISYIIIVGIILVNVVIAVLLEKMVDSGEDEEGEGEDDDFDDVEEAEEAEDGEAALPAHEAPAAVEGGTVPSEGADNSNEHASDDKPEAPVQNHEIELQACKPNDGNSRTEPPSVLVMDNDKAAEATGYQRPAKRLSTLGAGRTARPSIYGGGEIPISTAAMLTARKPRRPLKTSNQDSMFLGGKKELAKIKQETEITQSHLILTLIEKVDILTEAVAEMKGDIDGLISEVQDISERQGITDN